MSPRSRFRTIVLANPPADQTVAGVADGWAQPTGLLCLGAALRCSGLDIELEIVDGDVVGAGQLESQLHGDLVGLSCTIGNYRAALRAAEIAKKNGAFVVLGGPYASSLGELIMKKRREVDALVVGYGELPFVNLVAGMKPASLPNTFSRINGRIVHGPMVMDQRKDVLPDYKLFPLESYWCSFQRTFPDRPFHRPLTVPSQRGCPRRLSNAACIFCAVIPAAWRSTAPEAFWNVVIQAEQELGVDYIFETSEDFAVSKGFLERLAASRPKHTNVKLDVGTRADRLTAPVVELLKALDVFEVFVGVESGSDIGLTTLSKGTRVEQSIEAARRLRAAGIRMFPGFIVGVPGETEATLTATLNHARQLRDIGLIERSLGSHFTPLPGAPAFTVLLGRPQMREKYANEDILSLDSLAKDWAEELCHVDFERLREARDALCN